MTTLRHCLPTRTCWRARLPGYLLQPGSIRSARAKARIFGRDLRDAMDCSGPLDTRVLFEKQSHLISLYDTGPLALSMPAERAAELFDHVVAWDPSPPPR